MAGILLAVCLPYLTHQSNYGGTAVYKKKIYPVYLVLPILIIYTLAFIIPIFSGIYFSFTNWSLLGKTYQWVGLANYKQIFVTDRSMVKIIFNTILFASVTTFFANVVGLALALLLNSGVKGQTALRSIFYFPNILPALIVGMVFSSILDPAGFLNNLMGTIGLESLQHAWLADPAFALISVMFVEVWKSSGFCMIVYLAGLQTIPSDYLEAADIDGASGFKKLFNVILPLLIPSLTTNVIFNFIVKLKTFDLVYVLTGGGPGKITQMVKTIVLYEYSAGRYGIANAMESIMFIATGVIAYIMLRFFQKKEVQL